MKKYNFYVVSLFIAVLLNSCSWDSTVYDEYINPDGTLSTCPGYCEHNKTINTLDECRSVGGAWDSAINYCEISELTWTPQLCATVFKGKWYGRKGTDLGNGRYIIVRSDNASDVSSVEYICGSYDYVTDNNNPANTCDDAEIETLKHLQRVGLCTNQANHCVLIKTSDAPLESSSVFEPGSEENSKDYLAICSECDSGQASCSIDGTSKNTKCVDILSSNDHCGNCLNKCDSESQQCRGGVCVEIGKCEGERCEDGTCIDPKESASCGFTTCNEYNTWKENKNNEQLVRPYLSCPQNADCTFRELTSSYYCKCPYDSDIIYKTDDNYQCLSPSNPQTCGALDYLKGNSKGENCILSGQQCIFENNKYVCKQLCDVGEVYCSDVPNPNNPNELGACVEKMSNAYCGATPDPENNNVCGNSIKPCAVNNDFVCGNDYTCQCRAGFVNCNGSCINPNTDNNYCGAFNTCSKAEMLAGKQCDTTKEQCSNGKCECSNGYVRCGNDCIDPQSNNEYCGVDNLCTFANYDSLSTQQADKLKGNCSKYNGINAAATSICNNGTCKCETSGYELALIDRYGTGASWQCVDPQTDSMYCSDCVKGNTKENCNSGLPSCAKDYQCKAGKCEKSECKAPNVQCGSFCVDPELFHVNSDCTGCTDGFCADNFQYATGCFNNPNTDPNNCGTCGNVCPSGASCINKVCSCPTGYSLCKTDSGHDECVNLKVLHYKSCNVCEDGWADADQNSENGCETNIAYDPNHCGGIGNKCYMQNFSANVARACAEGQCLFTCKTGYADCNSSQDGCETEILNNPKNCGQCGMDCTRYDYSKNCNHGECCSKDKASYLTTCCDGLYNIKTGNGYSSSYACQSSIPQTGCLYRGTSSSLSKNTSCCSDSTLWKNGDTYMCSPDDLSGSWCIAKGSTYNKTDCCTDSNATHQNGYGGGYYTCTPK